jgi:putative IMPACT (imprinted ancient) family translation regulator
MSDDGEPHGTAGRPMLAALLHSGVGEVVAVVTRWYGGTKLGTGGLARAYAGTVTLALESLPTTERVDWATLNVRLGYPHVDAFRRLLPDHEATVLEEEFGATLSCVVRLPASGVEAFGLALADATRGEASVKSEVRSQKSDL